MSSIPLPVRQSPHVYVRENTDGRPSRHSSRLGGSADIDKVLDKLREFAERCLPEGTENSS